MINSMQVHFQVPSLFITLSVSMNLKYATICFFNYTTK